MKVEMLPSDKPVSNRNGSYFWKKGIKRNGRAQVKPFINFIRNGQDILVDTRSRNTLRIDNIGFKKSNNETAKQPIHIM
jgi:hypothetical protein